MDRLTILEEALELLGIDIDLFIAEFLEHKAAMKKDRSPSPKPAPDFSHLISSTDLRIIKK